MYYIDTPITYIHMVHVLKYIHMIQSYYSAHPGGDKRHSSVGAAIAASTALSPDDSVVIVTTAVSGRCHAWRQGAVHSHVWSKRYTAARCTFSLFFNSCFKLQLRCVSCIPFNAHRIWADEVVFLYNTHDNENNKMKIFSMVFLLTYVGEKCSIELYGEQRVDQKS